MPTPRPTLTPLLLYSSTPLLFYSSTALLLYSSSKWHCLQHYCRLQVLVTGRTRYWSTTAHWVCVPLVVQAGTCYSSCFWSTALSSSLLLSGFHLACTSTSLGAISLRFPPVSFYAAVCCQARGSYWYTVNRLLQQTLLHKPIPFYGFVFVFLSYSSYSCSSSSSTSSSSPPPPRPSFLFCSPPRMHIKIPWGHLSMAGRLAEGN